MCPVFYKGKEIKVYKGRFIDSGSAILKEKSPAMCCQQPAVLKIGTHYYSQVINHWFKIKYPIMSVFTSPSSPTPFPDAEKNTCSMPLLQRIGNEVQSVTELVETLQMPGPCMVTEEMRPFPPC